ncbi:uncharacterized protein LOC142319081 [Lycorma delicatula]|uniref:uncharacterized protein LOC142319081 n=1 Tax=Lycorma delicatula TaxID=130591 RepID=UPI003F5187A5
MLIMDQDVEQEQEVHSPSQILDEDTSLSTSLIGKEICWDEFNNESTKLNLQEYSAASISVNTNTDVALSHSLQKSFCALHSEPYGFRRRKSKVLRSRKSYGFQAIFNSSAESSNQSRMNNLTGSLNESLHSIALNKKKSSAFVRMKSLTKDPDPDSGKSNDFQAVFNSSTESSDQSRINNLTDNKPNKSLRSGILNKKKSSAFLRTKSLTKNPDPAEFQKVLNSTADDSVVVSPKNKQRRLDSVADQKIGSFSRKQTSAFCKIKSIKEKEIVPVDFQDAFDSSSSIVKLSQNEKSMSNEKNVSKADISQSDAAPSNKDYMMEIINDGVSDDPKNNDEELQYNEAEKSQLENYSLQISNAENEKSDHGNKILNSCTETGDLIKDKALFGSNIGEIEGDAKISSRGYMSGNSQQNSLSVPGVNSINLSANIEEPNSGGVLLLETDYDSLESSSESDDDGNDGAGKNEENLDMSSSTKEMGSIEEKTFTQNLETEINNSKCVTSSHSSLINSHSSDSNNIQFQHRLISNNSKSESSLRSSGGSKTLDYPVITYSVNPNYNSMELTTESVNEQSEYLLNNSDKNESLNNNDTTLSSNLDTSLHHSQPSYNNLQETDFKDVQNFSLNNKSSSSTTSRLESLRKRCRNDGLTSTPDKENARLSSSSKKCSQNENVLGKENSNLSNELISSKTESQRKRRSLNYQGSSDRENSRLIKNSSSEKSSLKGTRTALNKENSQLINNDSISRTKSRRKRNSMDAQNISGKDNSQLPRSRSEDSKDDILSTESKNISQLTTVSSVEKSVIQNVSNVENSLSHISLRNPKNRCSIKNKSSQLRNKNNETPNFDSYERILNCIPLSELRKNKKPLNANNILSDCNMINEILSYKESEQKDINTNDENATKSIKMSKLKKPKNWVSQHLYNFIISKLEVTYKLRSRLRAESFVVYLSDKVDMITALKEKDLYQKHVQELILEMARLKLIKTLYDFYDFVCTYLPDHFYHKSVPSVKPFGRPASVPIPPSGTIFNNIL